MMTRDLYQPVTTVFKPSENVKDSFSLYVNGQKTNIYYFTKPMLFICAEQQRKNAMLAERFINEGKVYPKDDNWTGFDLCVSCQIIVGELKPLSEPGEWSNTLMTVLIPYRIPPQRHLYITQKWVGRKVNTQFCKRIVQDRISDNIGIHIDNYGYSLYFI